VSSPSPELWAGLECTLNRVGGTYYDQLQLTGHANRPDDLERFAELGIRTLRYPLLWERIAPRAPEDGDWAWARGRMDRLRALGMRPVVGLMHHGSGPDHTSLVDPDFPAKLARYAAAAAERFPGVDLWIPINEPLTTARFSCLYGHWYPHVRDDRLFARAILIQCRAVRLAMQAIRRVNPAARLIQTEDLGRTFSTGLLAYQAELENHRRWLTFDLLTGRVTPAHPMWDWLRAVGIPARELHEVAEHPCAPDIIGINHYLTSERFLDERLERYPERWRGGNGRHAYADVEAVRVCADGPSGLAALLREVWTRYDLPIAITEAHLDCTREEQLRWLVEVRHITQRLSDEGVRLVALTVWSLLGSYNWNELMAGPGEYYESGVFDVRGGRPRPTILGEAVRRWNAGETFDHPVLQGHGWWRRPVRLLYPPVPSGCGRLQPVEPPSISDAPPILAFGCGSALRQELERACHLRDLAVRFDPRPSDDERAERGLEGVLGRPRPWACLLAVGASALLAEPARRGEGAGAGLRRLVNVCTRLGIQVVLWSGCETQATRSTPQGAEPAAGATESNSLTVRVKPPVDLPAIVRTMLDLIVDDERGIWQATGGVLRPVSARGATSIRRSRPMCAGSPPAPS
jgi:dTDP-4-dehydrorhamnose reductase